MLKTYHVYYDTQQTPHVEQCFTCKAENSKHAKEQCLNAHPDVNIYAIERDSFYAH